MLSTLRAIIVMGPPLSGKTTYALSHRFDEFKYISPDLYGSRIDEAIREAMLADRNLIIDDYNGSPNDRAFYVEIIKSSGRIRKYQIECHVLKSTMQHSVENGRIRQSQGGVRLSTARYIKYRRTLKTPDCKEFSTIIEVPFFRSPGKGNTNPAIFLSLSSIWRSTGERDYPANPDEVEIFPDVAGILSRYSKRGYRFVLVTNFPEIGDKQIAESMAQECMVEAVKRLPVDVEHIYYSPHSLDAKHDTTLPNPMFAYDARDKYHIDLGRSIMVGNSQAEKQFAELASFGYYYPRDLFFWNGVPRLREHAPDAEAMLVFGGYK